ncbi:hypothetical protein [Gordonia sp. (in: high G+C Gram-positive bacteria)]|uniref:hypothetical protein n=1 Tax=Gordonia sp. (in: high G+C Gram-positive bacteria) TaxID=84139 RepID=UPI001DF3003F|nr:hypothetical protein [Gordonia sp. (in: high G+C Gram-positive bacteria)]MCB1294390.1 hypothetical protein [Gordonia sp. (in: high G+C Gram-positive bacteria)]HMS77236.1 hypothetical protein [Gordonia sp. (in: high G+C Gram-positive bacteria)]
MHPALADAVRESRRPVSVAVTGRPGTGRSTMVRALRRRLSIDSRVLPEVAVDASVSGPGMSGPDLWCHVLSGPPRAADRRVVDALPVDRIVVVLTKADVYGPVPDPGPVPVFAPDAVVTAARCARELDRPVHPVSALWAVADPGRPQLELLAALAAAGETVPELAGHFTTPTGVRDIGPGDEEKLRIGLLRSMDRWGVELVTRELAAGRIGPDVAQIAGLLHAASGLGALAGVITACAPAVAAARDRRLGAVAERIAARGDERTAAELLLAGLGRAR